MQYLLTWHIREEDLIEQTPERRERIIAALAVFENELDLSSELAWVGVLAPESQAVVVSPNGSVRDGIYNSGGTPTSRVWQVRVESEERALTLAARLADALDAGIEVRECLPGAQRP